MRACVRRARRQAGRARWEAPRTRAVAVAQARVGLRRGDRPARAEAARGAPRAWCAEGCVVCPAVPISSAICRPGLATSRTRPESVRIRTWDAPPITNRCAAATERLTKMTAAASPPACRRAPMAHAQRPTPASALRAKCGARGAQASVSPAVVARCARAHPVPLRTLERPTLPQGAAARSPRKRRVTAAAIATRSFLILARAGVQRSTVACISTVVPTAAMPTAPVLWHAPLRSLRACRLTPSRIPIAASKVASSKPNARLRMPPSRLPPARLLLRPMPRLVATQA